MDDLWRAHTVVFDLDDTLYPERDFVLSGFAAVDTWLQGNHRIGGFAAKAEVLFAAGHRGRIFDQALELLDVSTADALVPAMIEIYRHHAPALRLYSDADHALEWVGTAGLRTALITDGISFVQRAKIRALGLETRIQNRIVTDELGGKQFWKPHQEAFLRVMRAHSGPSSGYVYIADNPRKDFIAPRQLGWRTLRVRRAGCEHTNYEGAKDDSAERESSTLANLHEIIAA
jgi:putative hydrolase of the HAD superfamily